MAWLRLPSEKGTQLTEAEGEALFAIFRAAVSKTITSDVLTVEGTGRYVVSAQTGVTDQITSIVVSQENVDGCLIEITGAAGHSITMIHGGVIHLNQGVNVGLSTFGSTLWMRRRSNAEWYQAFPAVMIP